jgi:asparagine synthase (glutamine-hydrolysing)
MQTLVNRGDRAAAINSMDARVPFAHQELTEYLFNVPFEMKTRNGERKSLLREYAKGLLPETIRTRPKSPYPKTYDPGYEMLINNELLSQLAKPSCPLHELVDKDKAATFCRQVKDLGRPWYGQLMAGPQLVAHYLQILYWLEMYKVDILI